VALIVKSIDVDHGSFTLLGLSILETPTKEDKILAEGCLPNGYEWKLLPERVQQEIRRCLDVFKVEGRLVSGKREQ
jgi:hypothetical protein